MSPDILILTHPVFGMLAILSSVWLLIEAINANKNNRKRMKQASLAIALFMTLALLFGGQWYVTYYPAEKGVILHGAWPFAHNFFMEVKEHLFFIPLILSLYLPIVVRNNTLDNNQTARKIVITSTSIIIMLSLFIEGAGAIINEGAKTAYKHSIQGDTK